MRKALELFNFSLEGAVAADIGASTGGFTDCMLQKGAIESLCDRCRLRTAGLEAAGTTKESSIWRRSMCGYLDIDSVGQGS